MTTAFGLYGSHRIALLILSLALLILVLELVRRNLLRERYALLWLATSLVGLIVGLFPDLIVRFSAWMHFQYLTALFFLTFSFVLALVLAFSVVLSRQSERNRRLAQEVALLQHRLKRLEHRPSDTAPESRENLDV
jgi:cell division protein FtsW (lipid II flippase)